MRLFFIVDNNQPHASGGGYYAIFKFAEFMAMRGHNVYVESVNDLQWVKPCKNLEINYRLSIPRTNRFFRKLDKILAFVYDIVILKQRIKKFRPDWVLGVLTESAIKAVRHAKKNNTLSANFIYECPPWVETMVGTERFRREYVGFTKNLWEKTRLAYLGTDVLFPNSELSREYNSVWLGGKNISEPIYPGIESEQMPFAPVKDENERPKILYVGRLARTKNVHQLIQAFLNLKTPAQLHICGEGPEKKSLVKMAGNTDTVVFHGFTSESELWSLFNACDLVVFPSSFEGFGMPPMQALYFGKPCLVSDIPIFRSVYGDRLEYFPLNNIEKMTEMIERLLTDRHYRVRRGKNGREFVLKNFTWPISALKIEKALQDYQNMGRGKNS